MSETRRPPHCTDPATHSPHVYADDTEHRDCPGTSLRDRIADALYAPPAIRTAANERFARFDAESGADAVMGVVGPEIASMWDQIDRDQHTAMDAHAALDRVRELHSPREMPAVAPLATADGEELSEGTSARTECAACRTPYPCPTIRTIDGSTNE